MTPAGRPARTARLLANAKPLATAILMGGFAGLIALLTFQGMLALQRLVWGAEAAGPLRIFLTILCGGALLIALARIAPTESMDELLRDAERPWLRSRRTITVTALSAIVAVAFGGAIGPEAGLLAVIAQCSAIVSRLIARDEAAARAIAEAGAAGALGGLYASPPAAAALDGDRLTPSRFASLVAAGSGFFVFLFVARTVFGGEGVTAVPLPEASQGVTWLLVVPACAGLLLGAAFRLLLPAARRVAAAAPRPWVATAVGTVLFAGLAAAVPLVRFSGHHDLGTVNALAADGAWLPLALLAAAKLVALVLCLAAGWRGGEIFPLIFIGAAVGAASAALWPELDPAAAVMIAMAATVTVGWRRPLAAFLLLVLVVDGAVALPLLAGVGAGLLVNRVCFPAPGGEPADARA
ncbi:chloride channel protein [Leucobacter chromiireducens]|uniref:chloride channel protein n=1 Tax=Leucobacter chromiireducens TaxID=283877 RepID=UPI000F63D134|nr:chloride channel protein [Leucobacter chromiireducens]